MEPVRVPLADLQRGEVREYRRLLLLGPEGSGIGDLPAVEVVTSEGVQVVSYWQPNESERAAIAAGAPVVLQVATRRMPAVALYARGAE